MFSTHPILRAAITAAFFLDATAQAQDWQAGASAEWQKTLAAAKKEARIAVAGPPHIATQISQGFLRDTGIQVEYLGGESRSTASRVTREVRANNVTLDFFFTGTAELMLAKEGFFEDLAAKLMLPGAKEAKNWKGGELKWIDNTKRFMLQTHAYVSAVPFYNSNLVKAGELTSWKDMLKPQFKGKIVAYDPRSGGPGQSMAGYVGSNLGMDFVRQLYVGQGPVYSMDSRQMAEWVTRGVHAIGLGILAPDFISFRNAGIKHLQPTDLKDGPGNLSGGFSVVMIPRGAPRPNAAIVFLNWFASKPGQEIFTRAYSVPSRRVDVGLDGVPEYIVPKANVKYEDQYNEDFITNVRQGVIKQVVEITGGR
ncbi:MAG: ABC transporter substrate-binding protein [Burkholderiales bacterium]